MASTFLELETSRACEWCSAPIDMKQELPGYANKPLYEWDHGLLEDLRHCYDCVEVYHRLEDELIRERPEFKKKLQLLDTQRLKDTVKQAFDLPVERKVFDRSGQDVVTKLQLPLMEMLRYPYFLHHKELATLFVEGLITLNKCESPLKLEEKLPGTYLLLVHPDAEVRGWAIASVRDSGLLNPDDYDFLAEVIGWMMNVVQFNLFENIYSLIQQNDADRELPFDFLPPHLFMELDKRFYWQSLFVLIRQMDVSTVQTCFMTSQPGHDELLTTILLSMEEQDKSPFWPMLQCFVLLLERLGSRIWQMPKFNYMPTNVFRIITENWIYSDSITQWQHGSETPNRDWKDSKRTRTLSSSSSKIYKTAVAWFDPFVKSFLDFDSGGEIVSKVVRYLHDVADRCSPGSSFRHEVLSHFVRIVNDLLNKRLFSLLVPTVRLWATDVVDVAISVNGSVDKKVVEVSQRLLQGLLKDCHRKGYKNALKYRDMFQLSGPKFLSSDDKQQIILLLVQNFETQEMPFSRQPGLRSISKSSYELQVLKECNAESLMSHVNNGELQMQSTLAFDKMPVDKENQKRTFTSVNQETIRTNRRPYETSAGKATLEGHEKDSAVKYQTKFDKGKVAEARSTTLSTLNDQRRKKKIDSSVGSSRMAGPCGTSSQKSAVKAHEEEAVIKRQISVDKGNKVQGRPDTLRTPGDQPRKRKIDSMVRSWGKAGPSTRVSDDEGENEVEKEDDDDQEGYWTYFKRRKKSKQHHTFGNVKISEKSNLLMKGKPLRLKILLHDIGKQVKEKKFLRGRNRGTCTVSTSKKPSATDKKIQKTGIKRPLKPKAKYTARKSAGSVKKRPPSQRKQGATAADPIVVSDEEDSALAMLEEKRTFSKGDKDPVTENHFFEDDEESVDDALLQMMDTYEAEKEAKVSGSLNATLSNSSLDATSSSETDCSEDAFKSLVKQEFSISSAVAPQDKPSPTAVKVKHTAKGCRSDERVETFTSVFYPPNVKAELIETDRDTILYPELRVEQLSVHDDKRSGSKDEAEEDSLFIQQDSQCPSMSESMVQDEPNDRGDINLSSISNRLENATIDDGTNFWDDFCDYSELVLGSQENALVSIEDDLEDVYSTQTQDNQENSIVFLNDDNGHEAYHEPHSDTLSGDIQGTVSVSKAVKRVTFSDNTAPVTTATSASRSNGVQPSKPAIKTPTRVLKEELFFHEILNWNVSCLGNSKRNIKFANSSPIPEGFDSIDQYYETFTPLLFVEILEQARKSWEDVNIDKKKVFMNVSDGSASNNLSVIPCIGSISEDQQKKALFPLESDLVVLRLAVNDGRGSYLQPRGPYAQVVFGIVEKADVKPMQYSRRLSLDSNGEDDLSGSREFQLTLEIKTSSKFRPVRESCIQVEYVTSLLTAMRQFCGLMHFSKSLLVSDILKPRKAVYFCSEDYQQSSLVSKKFNQSQEKVISTAANAIHKEFPLPRICLVQGPPGTGKSFTIVGLVREILNRPPKVATQSSSSSGPLADKPRILLCAPSNGAIDELIGQVAQALIRLDKRKDDRENRKSNRKSTVKEVFSRNCGDLSLVRVGRKSHIHPSVLKFSLDSLTKEVKERQTVVSAVGDLNSIREKLKIYEHREKELDIEILELKNSPFPDNNTKLSDKIREKEKLKTTKNELRMKYRSEKAKDADSRRQEARIRRDILDSADIVCTTLSGAGSRSLKRDLQQAGRPICPFTCVIVDEACQCTELDVLIALEHMASKLVLVGDPEQLPPTVLSMKAKEKFFGRSMFERLYRFFRHHGIGKPVLMLEEQYRMHPEIASFPSQHVYSSRLKSHSSLAKRRFWLDKHYALFDVIWGQEISQERGALWNPAEVEIIADLCSKLTMILKPESVGIITPYRKQKTELQRKLHERGLSRDGAIIEVNTVDGFQGREKDVIILSCVRAKNVRGSIGFVSDRQRMNVALTRARHALYVFGHMDTLKGDSKDWGALIEDAQVRHCLFRVASAGDVQSVLSLGVRNDERSPAKDPRQNHQTGSATRLENTKVTPTLTVENQRSKKTANGTFQQEKALSRDSSGKLSSFDNNVMNHHAVNSATNALHISSTNSVSTKEMDRHNARENNSRQRHHQNSAEMEAREKNSERRDPQKQPESHANNHHHRHQHVSKKPHFSERKEHQRHHPSYRKEHEKKSHAKHDYAKDNMRQERPALTEQSNKRQKLNGDGIRSLSLNATHHSATAYSLNNSSDKERTDNSHVSKRVVSPTGSTKHSKATGPSNLYLGPYEDHLHKDARLTAAKDSALQRDTIKESNSTFLRSFEYEDYLKSPSATSSSPTVFPRSPSETSAGHSTVTQSTSAQQFSRSWPSVSRRNQNQLPSHEFPQQYGRSFNGKHTTYSPAVRPTSSTSTTQTRKAPSAVASDSMSWNRSEVSRPSVSPPSPGIHEAGSTRITREPSTSSLSNGSDRPMSTHSLGRRSSGLDPGAERAANLVRERHPPSTGPQIISAAAALFGRRGSRGAHVASGEEVERLRQKGIVAAKGEQKKDGKDHSRRSLNKQKAKWGENLRCHKSWNKR